MRKPPKMYKQALEIAKQAPNSAANLNLQLASEFKQIDNTVQQYNDIQPIFTL